MRTTKRIKSLNDPHVIVEVNDVAAKSLSGELVNNLRQIRENVGKINMLNQARLALKKGLADLYDLGLDTKYFRQVKEDMDNQAKWLSSSQNYLKKRAKRLASMRERIRHIQ